MNTPFFNNNHTNLTFSYTLLFGMVWSDRLLHVCQWFLEIFDLGFKISEQYKEQI